MSLQNILTASSTTRRIAALVLLAGIATACDPNAPETDPAVTDATELAVADDADYVNVSGTVVSTAPEAFVLDYGLGEITVEMDDWDFYDEGRVFAVGDEVVVSGFMDENLFANRTIEASSVYVENLNSYFYASGVDEEEFYTSGVYVVSDPSAMDITGRVTSVSGRTFDIGTGLAQMTIDTSQMSYNPLDDEGFQKIDVGDRVYAWGDVNLDPEDDSGMIAEGIVSLTPDMGNGGNGANGVNQG